MDMAVIAAILAFVSVGVGIVSSMMIVAALSRRGKRINYVLLRIRLFQYVAQYKRMTLEETGRVAPLYYVCVWGYLAALVFTLIYLAVR